MPFISIQLNSNRPEQIVRFFDSIDHTADNPSDIEVLLHIDRGDTGMELLVGRERLKRRFTLKVLQTDLVKDYSTLWKPLNALFTLTDPEAYFVTNLSDEVLFATRGWDTTLRSYVGYHPDHIFRLRASKYRYRNYTDFWECGFAPDSMAFYTRQWLALQGDWNPCLGPDSFQQCIAYYLYTSDPFSHRQYNRDIPLPFMCFSGEGANIGLEGEALHKRMCINNRAWFTLMSHRMQQEASRRAMRLKSHIVLAEHKNAVVEHNPKRRTYTVRNTLSGHALEKIPYSLSRLRVTFTLLRRAPLIFYYAGGGLHNLRNNPLSSLAMMLASFTPLGPKALGTAFRMRHRFRHAIGVVRHHGLPEGLLMFIEIMGSLLLPDIVKRPIREPYLKARAWTRNRINYIRGVSQEHGRLSGLFAAVRTVFVIVMPVPAADWMRRRRADLRHYRNHIRGVARVHGTGAAANEIWGNLLSLLGWARLRPYVRAPYRRLRHIYNHIRGVFGFYGVSQGLPILMKDMLRPLDSALQADIIHHPRRAVHETTPQEREFAAVGLPSPMMFAPAHFPVEHSAGSIHIEAIDYDDEYNRQHLHPLRDLLSHIRGVLDEKGLYRGFWQLQKDIFLHVLPRLLYLLLLSGGHFLYRRAHHTRNHVVGTLRYYGGVIGIPVLFYQGGRALIPHPLQNASAAAFWFARDSIHHLKNHVVGTFRYYGPLMALPVLCVRAAVRLTPASIRHIAGRLLLRAWRSRRFRHNTLSALKDYSQH